MRLLFMGTPDFAVPTLQCLIDSEHEVVAVITQPDRPKGRGKQVDFTPVKALALTYNIPVYQPNSLREAGFVEKMAALDIDLAVVVAFGQILRKPFLEMPKYGCINGHASILPKLRGAGPIQWSVINGFTETGITTMFMDEGIDTGDRLLEARIGIESFDTGGTIHDKLMMMEGPLILKTIQAMEDGSLVRRPQNNDEATYAPMLDKKLGNIKWASSAETIERLIRGLNPWPSAYTYLEGKMLKVWEAQVLPSEADQVEPGTIIDIRNEGIVVACGKDTLLIESLQLQGKKRMATRDFLRGYNLNQGTQLSTIPQQDKER